MMNYFAHSSCYSEHSHWVLVMMVVMGVVLMTYSLILLVLNNCWKLPSGVHLPFTSDTVIVYSVGICYYWGGRYLLCVCCACVVDLRVVMIMCLCRIYQFHYLFGRYIRALPFLMTYNWPFPYYYSNDLMKRRRPMTLPLHSICCDIIPLDDGILIISVRPLFSDNGNDWRW